MLAASSHRSDNGMVVMAFLNSSQVLAFFPVFFSVFLTASGSWFQTDGRRNPLVSPISLARQVAWFVNVT